MDPQNWRPDWIFAIRTLLIRFFGIFVVLAILQMFMQMSGSIFKRVRKESDQKTPLPPAATGSDEDVNQQEIAASIGVALSLYESERGKPITFPIGERSSLQSSDWTIMGRIAQLQSRVFKGRH